jgi:hypothetical protein
MHEEAEVGTEGTDQDRRRYLSYLLRLWQTERGGALVWRASLQSAHADRDHPMGERRGFASLAELFAFLEQETALGDEEQPCTLAGDVADT